MNIKNKIVIALLLVISVFLLPACNTTEVEFMIQFDSNGGSHVSSIVTDGSTSIRMPDDPVKDGYIFAGWYWDNNTFRDLFTVSSLLERGLSSDLTVYAKWTEDDQIPIGSVQVTFDSMGGTEVEPVFVQPGKTILIPRVSRVGYTLAGWYTSLNEGLTLDERWSFTNNAVNNDITLYAKWNINQYTITFDSAGGSMVNAITQDYDSELSAPVSPEREGYTFVGWSPELPEKMPAENLTVVAEWQINAYTITFNSNGGSDVASITQDYNTEVNEPNDPTRLGYSFAGWYRNAQLTQPYIFDRMPAEDQTLYAKWNINQYTITFDTKGGTSIPAITQDFESTLIQPDDPSREGYTFAGWFEDASYQETYIFDTMPAENITIHALWHNTISFESNGGSPVEPITRLAGDEVEELEEPTRIGSTFIGWFIDEALTEEYVFAVMPSLNITLYAKWDVNQYTVTFDAMGGEPMDPVLLDYGSDLSTYIPEKEGYIFARWYEDDTHQTIITHLPAYDVTIYAKWLQPDLVSVGEIGLIYTIPTGLDDSGTATVEGGYLMATTETTYELWYAVRVWAEASGYHFDNLGREGNGGTTGAVPTEENKHKPVTYVSWRDVIVWTNALSEMMRRDPVYRTPAGLIIKDSRDSNASQVDGAIQTDNNGYRLPTSMEWEMAARWRNSGGDGAILVGDRYWTPGDYASGAKAYYNNTSATRAVAWYYGASGGNFTRPVGQLLANHLGLYDMSGNVWEWTFTPNGSVRVLRGGSYSDSALSTLVGFVYNSYPGSAYDSFGFRMILGQ